MKYLNYGNTYLQTKKERVNCFPERLPLYVILLKLYHAGKPRSGKKAITSTNWRAVTEKSRIHSECH